MLVRDILKPAHLTIDTFATAIGDYPRVVVKIINGYWQMLPRVANRVVDLGPELLKRGAIRIPTYDEMMALKSRDSSIGPAGEDIPEELMSSKITQLDDVELASMLPGHFQQWSREHQAFTIDALLKATGWDSLKYKYASDFLVDQGFWSVREGLSVPNRAAKKFINVWRWNPRHYERGRGRPPVKRPPSKSFSPGISSTRPAADAPKFLDPGANFTDVEAELTPYVDKFCADHQAFTRSEFFKQMKEWMKLSKVNQLPTITLQHMVLSRGYATSNNGSIFYKR